MTTPKKVSPVETQTDRWKKGRQLVNQNRVEWERGLHGWIARYPDIPNCFTQGPTRSETLENLYEVAELLSEYADE